MEMQEFISRLTAGDRTDENLKDQIVDNMLKYGGSFVKSLANCCVTADYVNFGKLVDTFKNYFWEYRPEAWESKK
jgi:hypothetical protein